MKVKVRFRYKPKQYYWADVPPESELPTKVCIECKQELCELRFKPIKSRGRERTYNKRDDVCVFCRKKGGDDDR